MNVQIYTKEQKLTEGPILKKLIGFALPMIMGNLLQQVYNIADTIIVGRAVGSEALAAVGASYSLMTFLTSVMIGLCMGSSACMSISYGADRLGEMKEKIWDSFWLIGAVTVVITALVYTLEGPILHMLKVPKETYGLMWDYLRIIFAGIVFTFLYNYCSFLLRAVGNSVIPICFLGTASLLNIGLDLWFVNGCGFGVQGAAAATVLAQAFSGLGISLYVWKCGKELLPGKEERRFCKKTVRELAEYSVLTCLQQSVMNFGILMIQGLVNTFGTSVMAAFAAVVKIDTLAYMPAQEFGNAYSLYISQNYGAKKMDRIRIGTRKAFFVSGMFCMAVSGFVWISAKHLMQIFVHASETEILAEGVRYLHIEGAFYVGIGFLFLFYGLYRGIAKPAFSLVLTIVSLGTRVAIAYILAPEPFFGVAAIWWAIPIGWFLADVMGGLYYFAVIRKEKDIQERKDKKIRKKQNQDFVLTPFRQGLSRTLFEAIGTIYEEAEKKGVEIELESQHDQMLRHDRSFTAAALVYVLENAVKYCSAGDRVTVSAVSRAGRIEIIIRDTGMGIPASDLPHIFEKYYRGQNALQKEGYGIGLYLAKKILEKEDGTITCESVEGQGSTFTIFFIK